MKILVVGGGGREHAVVKKLVGDGRELFCAPGNAGIEALARCVPIRATDIDGMVNFCKEQKIDLCFVTPDDPLVLGMVDAMESAGIRAFGPSKLAAEIEGSKAFSKDMMSKYAIPTADYEVFTSSTHAVDYIKKKSTYPIVIKASGLALGKGVIIAQNESEATRAILDMIDGGVFGASGAQVVIEEFLVGQEVSVLAFTDGNCVRPMVSARDHKRAYDGDMGLNTGGMGTIAPNPYYTKDMEERAMREIFIPTINAMNDMGRRFKGILYFGLILTESGPKVIEYNCRLGDPEAQVCLPLLKTDLLQIIEAIMDERLADIDIEYSTDCAICVVMASGGYPTQYVKGKEIHGLNTDGSCDTMEIFHSGTAKRDGAFVTNGGRVLGLVHMDKTASAAQEYIYSHIDEISFEGSFYRNDIGGKRRGI